MKIKIHHYMTAECKSKSERIAKKMKLYVKKNKLKIPDLIIEIKRSGGHPIISHETNIAMDKEISEMIFCAMRK